MLIVCYFKSFIALMVLLMVCYCNSASLPKVNQNETKHVIVNNNTSNFSHLSVSPPVTSNPSYNLIANPIKRYRRDLSDFLIAPYTQWCGRGNNAKGVYNDLGGATAADKCCRRHDHCQVFIPAMSNRYELFNYRPYTLSHCNCDRRFHTCLKMADTTDATMVGKFFFNVAQTQCFVLKSENLCLERAADGRNECIKETVRQKAHMKKNKKF